MRRGIGGPPRGARPVKLNWDTPSPRSVTTTITFDKYDARADEPPYGPEWNAVRQQVLCRDNYTCTNPNCRVVYRPPKHGRLDAHHIKARRKGGTDTVDNLKTLCKPCHALEHSHLLRLGYGKAKSKVLRK